MTEYPMTEGRVDESYLATAGFNAATVLREMGRVWVVLEPGDATRYEVVIVDTHIERDRYRVATSFGPLYPWHGETLHPGYVTEKWVTNRNQHTGEVLARFLNHVSEAL